MTVQDSTELVRRSFSLISDKDMEGFQQLLDDDYVLHDQDDEHDVRGRREAVEYLRQYLDAFPDLRFEIDEIIADGDKVATRWSGRGTHEGTLLGIEPTKRTVTVHGMQIDTVRDGRIVETWQNWDAIGMFQQLGAMPSEAALAG